MRRVVFLPNVLFSTRAHNMLFTRFFTAALALVPAVLVLAAPASVNTGLSIREPPSPAAQSVTPLKNILARARANVGAIRSQLNPESAQSAKDASIKLQDTVNGLIGDLRALKTAKTAGQNVQSAQDGIFDWWPILRDVYDLIQYIITVVGEINGIISNHSSEGIINGVVDILKTIIKAVPLIASIVISILPFL
ncbi:hypothetical protein FRC10_000895 [Ceratobasidium sp. 414]|nr:hypothetical protein FRC10_000895 [Ceratobasidium sp. 414]